MTESEVPNDLACEVWKRDEFTCRYCGRTTPWEEVHILYNVPPEKGGKMEESNMITVCSRCVWEGKTGPVPEKEKQRLLSIIRELISYTKAVDDVVFEEDYEEEVLKLNKKIGSLKEDLGKLSGALQEKEKMAIAYKKKMDRAYQDMDNLKRRIDTEVQMKVREKTFDAFLAMITTIDDLERAINEEERINSSSSGGTVEGLKTIRKGMLQRLVSQGIVPMQAVGERFDPKYHEAIGTLEDEKVPHNTVLEVHQEGYMLEDQILRPARVLVSKGGPRMKVPEPEEPPEEFELDEEDDNEKVLELEPWEPEKEDEEYIVSSPKRKKKRKS
jgi:molecular chaperone GrpE